MKRLLIAGLLLRLFLSIQIYSGDVNNHVSWGQDILKYGPAGVYQRDFVKPYGTMTPTYPPLALFGFTLSKAAFNWTYDTVWNLNLRFPLFPSNLVFFIEDQDTQPAFFKVWAIAADIILAYIIFKLTKSRLAMCLVLFNPAFIYNSAYWGQLESLPLVFLLAGLYFKERMLSATMFVLALIAKQSSIIFMPLLLLPYTKHLKALFVPFLIFWLSFLPFFKSGNLLTFPFTTYLNKIQTGSGSDYVTDHAFNFWALSTGLGKIHDILPHWLGLTYQTWGLIFFGLVLLAVFKKPRTASSLYLGLALIGMGAFLFLTRMHSRYLLSALPFLLVYSKWKRWTLIPFGYLSGFYFLNLYHNWWAPRIPSLVNFISPIGNINLLIIGTLACFFILLVEYLKQ